MGLGKKTIDDENYAGKRVLVRCDFNVPMKDGVILSLFTWHLSQSALRKANFLIFSKNCFSKSVVGTSALKHHQMADT